MKSLLTVVCAAISLLCTAVLAGDITGHIHAHGKEGANQDALAGKYESRKFKFVERVDYDQFHDFVVYIDQPVPFKLETPPKPVEVITQKDATFKPHVLPILVGTTVRWPNKDEIFHNVFSFSEAAPFDLGLYKDEVKEVPFNKVGRVDALCSIHTQMHCIILVMENPYFTLSNVKGGYSITNVPPGTYRLRAWHERLPSEVKQVVVPEKGTVEVDFDLGIKGLPKY